VQHKGAIMATNTKVNIEHREVSVSAGAVMLHGDLNLPEGAFGIVLFAHGSGSSRHSPRNRRVAEFLNESNLATLLVDLLTPQEEAVDMHTGHLRFDIHLLAERLVAAIDWILREPAVSRLPIGYFGASTGAAAALVAAAKRPKSAAAVVSRGGRPDLAGRYLSRVEAPALLIVGGNDPLVLELNRAALEELRCEKHLEIVPRATHLFEEPGALDEVARLAREWFESHFSAASQEFAFSNLRE
jgi:putative phosphoribosyl transferase